MVSPVVVLLLLLLIITIASAPSIDAADGRALPGCQKTCGGVNIPYPFGIGAKCSRVGFEIACNGRTPFLAGTGYKVLNLSIVPAGARVQLPVAWTCYDRSGKRLPESEAPVFFNPEGVFRISDAHNQLVVVGCDVTAYIQSRKDNNRSVGYEYEYYTGCVSYCRRAESVKDGRCAGVGCCKVDIPPNLTDNSIGVDYDDNSSLAVRRLIYEFSPCSYGFLVERNRYTFRAADLKMDKKQTMPVWLDWAIRPNGSSAFNCSDVMKNNSSYACKSQHSSCVDAVNGPGYTCNCSDGFEGNAYIVDGCTGVICGSSCLTALSIFIFMLNEKRKLRAFFERNGGPLLASINNIKIYTKQELKHITGNFSIVLGKGSLGDVYEGTTNDNVKVAVKAISVVKERSDDPEVDEIRKDEFANEIKIQSQIIHKNIIKLLGCCLEVEIPMLVYEFAANGSLYDVLHGTGRTKSRPLLLQTRLDIAVDSAEALAYMHLSVTPKIFHGDVKSGNILLDENFMPKVSDFGTSRLLSMERTHTEFVIADKDYMDPVYITGLLHEKSDVYSYGVVLLELITRKKPCYDGYNSLKENFTKSYATEEKAHAMYDKEIAFPDDIEFLHKLGSVAVDCLREKMDDRPTMEQVADRLQSLRREWRQRQLGRQGDQVADATSTESSPFNIAMDATGP
ncbi:Wall-associated receptor kinase 1 [Dichanthelium oligosanthes]|uniref:Wall-associated receptor kinase 1 n=1 Tax=Dichanthelium oligosanthes TaxID=888268 RepID=A0A1E5W500_9POAL|nr:Wall-associated receptor kinase 1 [Dichanthelium oligosanthes]